MMTPHTPLLQKRHEKGKYQDLFTLILPGALQSAGVPAWRSGSPPVTSTRGTPDDRARATHPSTGKTAPSWKA